MKSLKLFLFISLIILSSSFESEEIGSHFSRNPNGQVGIEKTISIDGTPSDWELSMKIAQNIANNDPRVFAHCLCMK